MKDNASPIWFNRHGLVRVVWRLMIYFLLLLLFMIVGFIAFGRFLPSIDPNMDLTDFALLPFSISIPTYAILVMAIFAAGAIMVKRFDRRTVQSIGLGFHSRWKRELLTGLIIGAVFVSAIVLVLIATGSIRLAPGSSEGSTLARQGFLFFLLFTAVAVMEELSFRGYLLQSLAEGVGKVWAVLILSALFGLIHYANPGGTWAGAVATGVAGILLSLAYFRTRSLWLPIGIHITWNYFMGWVYALPVSGVQAPNDLFSTSVSGPKWLTGGEFGPEGSLVAFLAMGVMALFLVKSRRVDPSPEAAVWFPPPEERTREEEPAGEKGTEDRESGLES